MNSISVRSSPWWRRLWNLLVPSVPDFYGMLEAQTHNLRDCISMLNNYFESTDTELANRIHALVDSGHALRDSTVLTLHRSFVTPIDREDIYQLAMALDHILDYLKNTVREVEVLQVAPNDWMQRMTRELETGIDSLADGFTSFAAGNAEAVTRVVQTRAAERNVEDLYRDALEHMFGGEEYLALMASESAADVRSCLDFVVTRIKRREVYRHLSNAADRLAHAGETLRDIAIKHDGGPSAYRR